MRSGFRLCVTYNLTLTKSHSKKGLAAPSYGKATAAIGKSLSEWSNQFCKAWSSSDSPPCKLAITLEHRYSQDGLALSRLKGVDRTRAEVLFEAAKQSGCIAHLGLVTHWENGSADDDYEWFREQSRYGFAEDESDLNRHEMGEIFDESLSIDHWSDREGKRILFGEICLQEDEIISETPLDEWEISDEEYEGYTGNEGMTLERWYHRAAIVVWPHDKHFEVLCDAGKDAAIGGLEPMVRRLTRTAKSEFEEARQQCLSFATAIINIWSADDTRYWDRQEHVDRAVFPLLFTGTG